jgi:uncharacterized membrane protein YhaH (DUF805 family)
VDFFVTFQWLVTLAVALIIYQDAAANKIGRVKDERSLLNIPAGAWAAGTLFVIIIALPLYIIFRKRLIDRAKEKPVILTDKHKKKVFLALIVVGLVAAVVFSIP